MLPQNDLATTVALLVAGFIAFAILCFVSVLVAVGVHIAAIRMIPSRTVLERMALRTILRSVVTAIGESHVVTRIPVISAATVVTIVVPIVIPVMVLVVIVIVFIPAFVFAIVVMIVFIVIVTIVVLRIGNWNLSDCLVNSIRQQSRAGQQRERNTVTLHGRTPVSATYGHNCMLLVGTGKLPMGCV